MKIRHAEDIPAIYLSPGDSIELRYDEEDLATGEVATRTLHRECVGRAMEINRIAVVDFDDEELKPLGMDDAIGGVFGEKTKANR